MLITTRTKLERTKMKIDDNILNSPDNKNGRIRTEIGNIMIKNTNYKYIYTNFKIKRKKIEKIQNENLEGRNHL